MRPLSLVLAVTYPITLHLLLILDQLQAGLWLLLGIATGHLLLTLSRGGRTLVLPLAIIVATLWSLNDQNPFALYLPPLAIYSGLLVWFGLTLLPGREPLLTRMARIVFDDSSDESRTYSRKVTWLWSLLFLVMLIFTIGLTLFAPLETWSLFTNIINYLITAVIAMLEYGYRLWCFRQWPTRERLRRLLDHRRMAEWLRG